MVSNRSTGRQVQEKIRGLLRERCGAMREESDVCTRFRKPKRSEARLALLMLLWLVSAAIERRLRRPVFEGGAKRFND